MGSWFDPRYQFVVLVELYKAIYSRVQGAATAFERLAFTLSAYKGGERGLQQDRLLCRNAKGCDAASWFGHVEHHSAKSRQPWKGTARARSPSIGATRGRS